MPTRGLAGGAGKTPQSLKITFCIAWRLAWYLLRLAKGKGTGIRRVR